MSWTEERVAALTELWAKGHSASDIARHINERADAIVFTRNAVIGRVHRMGLSHRAVSGRSRPPPPRPKRKPNRKAQVKVGRIALTSGLAEIDRLESLRVAAEAAPAQRAYMPRDEPLPPEQPIPLHRRKSFQELDGHHCRWCVGDPKTADHHFCGAEKVPGLPYCAEHAARAYTAPARPPSNPLPRTRRLIEIDNRRMDDVREHLEAAP